MPNPVKRRSQGDKAQGDTWRAGGPDGRFPGDGTGAAVYNMPLLSWVGRETRTSEVGMRRERVWWTRIVATGLVLAFAAAANAQQVRRRPGSRGRQQKAPDLKVGDTAPDFNLATLDSVLARQDDEAADVKHVKLSDWRGKRPVALFFSSYT